MSFWLTNEEEIHFEGDLPFDEHISFVEYVTSSSDDVSRASLWACVPRAEKFVLAPVAGSTFFHIRNQHVVWRANGQVYVPESRL